MIRRLYDAITRMGDRYESFMKRMMNVETFGALVFILAFLGFAWAFAWYAHIIGPWVDNLMGWGPHDIDSESKVRWRRMWSTAICLPGILACIGLYIRNRRNCGSNDWYYVLLETWDDEIGKAVKMKFTILSWSNCGVGGNIRKPNWSDINDKLMVLETGGGTITLDGDEENGFEKSLQVRFEDGKYLLTFGYETENDWIVRTYQNGESRSEEITILGDVWRGNCICRDPAIVRQAFTQFFDTGTVSDDLIGA